MDGYIKKSIIIQELENFRLSQTRSKYLTVEECESARDVLKRFMAIIGHIPTESIPPEETAHWHYTDAFPHWVCCSACHKKFLPNKEWIELYNIPANYCPNCGRKIIP